MPAFRHSAAEGFVLEMDVKLTKDRVPVIMHDATLNRTTDCNGEVASKTLAQLRHCRVDILGSEGNSRHISPDSSRSASIPTLAHVLDFIKHEGARPASDQEHPDRPDYDPTDKFATIVVRRPLQRRPAVAADHQELLAAEPDRRQRILPDTELSFLTLSAANTRRHRTMPRHTGISRPRQWPVDAAYIADAHAQARIVPYTVDKRSDMVAAANDGVDAIITTTDRARRVFHDGAAAAAPPSPARRSAEAPTPRCHAAADQDLDPAGAPASSPCSSGRTSRTSLPTRPSGPRSSA